MLLAFEKTLVYLSLYNCYFMSDFLSPIANT